MPKKRNRTRPVGTFEGRLRKFASDVRAAARQMPPGRERDALIKKARQTENVLDVGGMLTGRSMQPSK